MSSAAHRHPSTWQELRLGRSGRRCRRTSGRTSMECSMRTSRLQACSCGLRTTTSSFSPRSPVTGSCGGGRPSATSSGPWAAPAWTRACPMGRRCPATRACCSQAGSLASGHPSAPCHRRRPRRHPQHRPQPRPRRRRRRHPPLHPHLSPRRRPRRPTGRRRQHLQQHRPQRLWVVHRRRCRRRRRQRLRRLRRRQRQVGRRHRRCPSRPLCRRLRRLCRRLRTLQWWWYLRHKLQRQLRRRRQRLRRWRQRLQRRGQRREGLQCMLRLCLSLACVGMHAPL
mmetsp:Transcript_24339/g.62049  ORF Transcript_24339/g.62049 Transcript_24339/m.62049 type:complete len:282 (+) Transcript_24339:1360-2205(+)